MALLLREAPPALMFLHHFFVLDGVFRHHKDPREKHACLLARDLPKPHGALSRLWGWVERGAAPRGSRRTAGEPPNQGKLFGVASGNETPHTHPPPRQIYRADC